MADDTRVLILTAIPERLGPLFEDRFPDLPIRLVDDPAAVDRALSDFAPTVIFAYPGEPVPKTQFPKLAGCPSVRWISNAGAGVEHLGPWDPAALTVTNASGVNARFLAQYTIMAHMAANIGLPRYARQQREKVWQRHEWKPFDGRRFCVVGLGNIGRAVAAHAKYFGMYVTGTRGTAQPTEHVDEVYGADGLLDALDGAEFVSVHAAQTPETTGLMNDDAFDAMADGAIFLNAARGPVTDEAALLRALDRGKVSTAILDVFGTEPLPPDSPFWDREDVIITPHMADSVQDWEGNMARAFADNLERHLKGDPLTNIVDPSKGY
jgi:phosphoglycerate dehydrogenase-like enzyme